MNMVDISRNDFEDSDEDLFDADLCALLDSTVADLSALRSNQQSASKPNALPQQQQQQQQGSGKKDNVHGGGLKWNAASSLSRAVAQKRLNTESPLTVGSSLPAVGDHMTVMRQTSNSIELPQKAQISEMQRQIDTYKQQLIFKQQEIEELKRQSGKVNQTIDVGARTRRFQSPSSVTIQGEKESPLLVSSKRGLEQPTTPSGDRSALYGDGGIPCLVPMKRVSMGSHVSLVDTLDKLQRHVDSVTKYRRARAGIFLLDVQQDDVANAVLVNLESGLLLRKHANSKDIFIMLLSTITHVVTGDCDRVVGTYQTGQIGRVGSCSNMEIGSSIATRRKMTGDSNGNELQSCINELTKFVGCVFEILNELVMDGEMCGKMIDLIQDPVNPLDVIKPAEKNVTHSIIQIIDTLIVLEEHSLYPVEMAIAPIVHFMHRCVRLRTEISKSIFFPILKSAQIQKVLLRYPSIRKEAIMLIMIFLEDKHTLMMMEHASSQELQVSPSGKMQRGVPTPTRIGSGTHRRHSITQPKIDSLGKNDSNSWASRLVQTVSLCLSMEHDVAQIGSWDTVRICLAFFANIMGQFSEALLASVLLQDKIEMYNVQEMFQQGNIPRHLGIVKAIPFYLVDIADKASGALNEALPPHISLLHPTISTDIKSQKTYFKMLRVVEESLMLLRGFMTHTKFGMKTTQLLAADNNWVLCILEKMTRYPVSCSDTARSTRRYPLALWARRMKLKNDESLEHDSCYPTVEDIIHVARLMKFAVLKQLDSDKL